MKNNEKLSPERIKMLKAFCNKVNIHFSDITLLEQAFHHRSVSNEKKELKNNERLEFLGDSVLGMVTAAYLYTNFENPEGDLAKIKSAVVSEKALAPVALDYGIDKLLLMGKGEELTGGRTKPAILADCMEAIIGAYYLDAGYKAVEKYVLNFISKEIDKVLKNGMKDFKTQLQEKYQKKYKNCPVYELIEKSGPDHNQTFKVVVHLDDKVYGPATAKNKRDAEQEAARIALEQFDFQK